MLLACSGADVVVEASPSLSSSLGAALELGLSDVVVVVDAASGVAVEWCCLDSLLLCFFDPL